MLYYDLLSEDVDINEPVVLEIINSMDFKRLEGVDMAGYRPLWAKPGIENAQHYYSRYAHSIGVYLLLRRFNAPVEEQLAGLLHDISHSAFSHCIDYAIDEGSEDQQSYQDDIHEAFIIKTEIPSILSAYGYDLDYILNDKNFPLKEQALPNLCADRIEYSLRSAMVFNEIDRTQLKYVLNNLFVNNKKWVFKSADVAKFYAELFGRLNTVHFSGLPSAIMFRIMGDFIKHGLARNYISLNDLYKTDKEVLDQICINLNHDEKLQTIWLGMNNPMLITNNPQNFSTKVVCKSRAVDPLFIDDGKLRLLSDSFAGWKNILTQELKP